MFSMIKFDVYVSGFMNTFNHTHLVLTEIGRWVSLIGDTAVVAILGVIISLWLATQKEWRLAIITFLTVGSTGFSLVVLKGFFMRARPDNALLVIVNDPSFPSGHAAMAAAFFVVVAYLAVRRIHSVVVRKLVIVGCVLATLAIGLSRVIMTCDDAGNRTGCVRCVFRAGNWIDICLCIAMIGGDDSDAAS